MINRFQVLLSNSTCGATAWWENLSRTLMFVVRGDVDVKFVTLDSVQVGRCTLTVSKPVLKARLVSALETQM